MSQRVENEKPIYVRANPKLRAAIAAIRRSRDPIPSVAELMRELVFEEAERCKPNGHRNGKSK